MSETRMENESASGAAGAGGTGAVGIPVYSKDTPIGNKLQAYLKQGWRVIPLRPRDKLPALSSWGEFQERAPSPGEVEAWLKRWPRANWAIITGAGSGIIVLDVDGPEGEQSLAEIGEIPETPSVKTGKGRHYYFAHPGGQVKNFAQKLPGLDLRGDGGYVVAPPSTHPSGSRYIWDISPDECEIADPPEWLLDLIAEPAAPEPRPAAPLIGDNGLEPYGRAALEGELAKLSAAPEGARNAMLNTCAFNLGQLVGVGALDRVTAERELASGASAIGLRDQEISATIRSGIEAGIREPRVIPENERPRRARPEPAKEKKRPIPTDDELRDRWLKDQMIAHGLGDWRSYSSGIWAPIPEADVKADICEEIERAKSEGVRPNSARLNSVLELARVKVYRWDDVWDADPDIMVCTNGTLELSTGRLRDHSPEDLATLAVDYDYDPSLGEPFFLKLAIERVAPEAYGFLQEFAGYCLTTDTRLETAIWFHGPPASGKSSILAGFDAMLGPRSGILGLADLERSRFGLAHLPGKTLMTASEQPAMYIASTHYLNAIISGEPIMADRKFRDPIEIRPRCKLAWAMNELPRVSNANNGLFRRVKVLSFPPLPEEDQDPRVKAGIEEEGPQILNWALAGLRRLRERGRFDPPACVIEATREFQETNDKPLMFVSERCVTGPDFKIQASELYRAYKAWCDDNGFRAESSTRVSSDWQRLNFERYRAMGKTFYRGLQLALEPVKL